MGKGDKKTRRGKIFQGSFGKLRPRVKPKKPLQGNPSPVPRQKVKPKRVP